jgi:hypothetical protein
MFKFFVYYNNGLIISSLTKEKEKEKEKLALGCKLIFSWDLFYHFIFVKG